MKMLLACTFGFLLAIFGINMIDQPLATIALIVLFTIGLYYDEIVATFTQEK